MKTNQINDMSVTNNGNSLKVLATVAFTIYVFIEKHPNSWIVATGSNDARTRLYRMGITNNLVEISNDFYIFGYTKNEVWGEFIVGYDYDAFLVTKKQKIMDKTMIERLNKSKLPIITIDKNLEKFRGKVLFPEKLELANRILAKTKLPVLKK